MLRQDEADRLWDVLFLPRCAVGRSAGTAVRFGVHVRNGNREHTPPLVPLKAVCGPGDQGELVVTVMQRDLGSPLPDTGYSLNLTGGGTLRPLGPVQVTGTLNVPGSIVGDDTVILTLGNVNGAVTLEFVGPHLYSFSGPPVIFAYAIIGGFGTYEGVSGTGTAALSEQAGASAGSFTLTFS